MTAFKELIEKNPDIEFVIHTRSAEELEELVTALEQLGYEFCLPFLGTIREKAAEFSAEDGPDGCWRISPEKTVSYNPSVEHWRLYTNDIAEKRDGEIGFNEGNYTPEDAAIEKRKLAFQFFEDEDKQYARRIFGFENADDSEIQAWLDERFGK